MQRQKLTALEPIFHSGKTEIFCDLSILKSGKILTKNGYDWESGAKLWDPKSKNLPFDLKEMSDAKKESIFVSPEDRTFCYWKIADGRVFAACHYQGDQWVGVTKRVIETEEKNKEKWFVELYEEKNGKNELLSSAMINQEKQDYVIWESRYGCCEPHEGVAIAVLSLNLVAIGLSTYEHVHVQLWEKNCEAKEFKLSKTIVVKNARLGLLLALDAENFLCITNQPRSYKTLQSIRKFNIKGKLLDKFELKPSQPQIRQIYSLLDGQSFACVLTECIPPDPGYIEDTQQLRIGILDPSHKPMSLYQVSVQEESCFEVKMGGLMKTGEMVLKGYRDYDLPDSFWIVRFPHIAALQLYVNQKLTEELMEKLGNSAGVTKTVLDYVDQDDINLHQTKMHENVKSKSKISVTANPAAFYSKNIAYRDWKIRLTTFSRDKSKRI